MGRGSNPLKSFFPFDPLLLRQSHEYIEPLYQYWQGPVEEEDVLVIDEIDRNRDPNIDVDDLSVFSETDGENIDSDDDSDDNDSDVYQSGTFTPETNRIKLLQQKAWTETLKRPRSQSMENGSW